MSDKLTQVRAQLDRWRVDGVLITSAANRRWLSGFTGSAGRILVTRDKAVLATDSRYWEQAEQQAPEFDIFRMTERPNATADFLQAGGGVRFGFEARYVTVAELKGLRKEKGFQWKALNTTLEPLRAIKSPDELAPIREAAQITDKTVNQVPRLARVGATEREVAWELEKFMRDSGADGLAFDIIVASGPNSALPHHHPGDRQLQAGDIIVVDLGAEVRGYRSDLTRTFYMGESAGEDFWDIFNTVHRAEVTAIEGIRSGVTGQAIDALARDIIKAAGHGDHFGHGTGHGVGLEIHESPRFSVMAGKDIIPAGAVMTVEPGIYLPGYGGVRIEDLVLVTDEGVELLSSAPKSPLIAL
ncbi:MAG: Xaa-Pro peptidase family protein [Anaerolineae bacterium]|nr:aminopeptidase P family protein [Promineifilum sp.]MCZ2114032.1 Xaa-Pro peptidase family protein [Anaerolineae bacterium]